jgi:uncharacterized protein (DUF302 family)
MAADGLITLPSNYGPKETMDRLEAEIRASGMVVFARVDHAAGAAQAGLSLRPTEVLIFGNAKAGTPLMQAEQTIGIDLPLKALVWQDANGKVWLSYNEQSGLAQRHGLPAGTKRWSIPWRMACAASQGRPPPSSDAAATCFRTARACAVRSSRKLTLRQDSESASLPPVAARPQV